MNSEAARPVSCPHCSARYLLPAQLLGPGGARITCPSCHRTFLVPASVAVPSERLARDTEAADLESAQASQAAEGADRIEPVALPPNAATPVEARPPTRAPSPGTPAPSGQSSPDEIAREVVEGLAGRRGDAIVAANAAGKLFAECGADILSAYDDYRRRAGSAAGAAPFRSALRDQLGIELPEGTERARR
jgi:predicted Zn finger-like uncharacterized protein